MHLRRVLSHLRLLCRLWGRRVRAVRGPHSTCIELLRAELHRGDPLVSSGRLCQRGELRLELRKLWGLHNGSSDVFTLGRRVAFSDNNALRQLVCTIVTPKWELRNAICFALRALRLVFAFQNHANFPHR